MALEKAMALASGVVMRLEASEPALESQRQRVSAKGV
jgi:hypothetical protein